MKLAKPKTFQHFLAAVPANTPAGKVIRAFIERREATFMKFAKLYQDEADAGSLIAEAAAKLNSLGYTSIDDYARKHPNVADLVRPKHLARPPGRPKSLVRRGAPHPAVQFDDAQMARFITLVRKEWAETGKAPLACANVVLARDFNITRKLRYLAFQNGICAKQAPDLILSHKPGEDAPDFTREAPKS